MARILSVDLGTTYSAAAVAAGTTTEMFALGERSAAVPTVVTLRADGTVLIGDVAERRGLGEPTRMAREFKRRLGDPVPIVLGGTPYGAETLMARVLGWIVERVTEEQGAAPDRVVLTHPANYGPYKLDLLEQVGRLADLDSVELLTEPEAAAVHYYLQERIEPGEVVAVYDLGGGTFDAALVRRIDEGFQLVGEPDGMDRFGGIDIDEAVFSHVRAVLGRSLDEIDPDDATVMTALLRLRDDCRIAKESLSTDAEGVVPVMLPSLHTEVRLTRGEFEDMIRPRIRETLDALDRVVRSTGLDWDGVSRVLLVGGSSRIPLVGEMVRSHTGCSIALDTNPKHAIALGAAAAAAAGAARSGSGGLARTGAAVAAAPEPEQAISDSEPVVVEPALFEPEPREPIAAAAASTGQTDSATAGRRRPAGRRIPVRVLAALGVVLALVAVVVIALVSRGGDGTRSTGGDEATATEPGVIPVDEVDPSPVGGEPPSDRVLALYIADYSSADLHGSWDGWAAAADADPPVDIAADYYPLLGPYDSTDPAVAEQHMAWLRQAGVGGIVVPWRGPDSISAQAAPLLLETGARFGVQVGFLVELESGAAEDLVRLADEALGAYAFDPNYLRTTTPDRDGRVSPRAIFMFRPPEGADPAEWVDAIASVRELAEGTVVLAASIEPAWVAPGGADGLVGAADAGDAWVGAIGDGWYVPTVRPGASAERVGEPVAEERDAGELYRRRWDEAAAPRDPTFFLVESFNQWIVGTQIEPAAFEGLPERPAVPYRSYEPLSPDDYLQLTREAVDAFGR